MKKEKILYNVYAEMTPNPDAIKFVSDQIICDTYAEFTDKEHAQGHLLPSKLFAFPFVKSVLIAPQYISVIKIPDISWDDIVLEMREFISQHLNSGEPVLDERLLAIQANNGNNEHSNQITIQSKTPENETEQKIVDVLNEYIRPAVESDGGAVEFLGFDNGKVLIALKGSCSGCPSSTITLKNGIEQLLRNMVPGVEEVIAESY